MAAGALKTLLHKTVHILVAYGQLNGPKPRPCRAKQEAASTGVFLRKAPEIGNAAKFSLLRPKTDPQTLGKKTLFIHQDGNAAAGDERVAQESFARKMPMRVVKSSGKF